TNSTVQPGAVYPGAPGGQPVLFSNETLSAPPFVYYNKDTGELNSSTNFRTGRGQTILLPLANGSLEVHNVDGSLFGWVPLRLAGQPATVTGTIGFTRSTSIDTMKLYLPVRSSSATTSRTDAHVAPEPFAITPPSNVSLFRYAGALGGTLYGTALIPQELYGVWTDASEGETTLFQLLGTVRTPLPPGTYPSGNHYVLGTDFRGADILTQLFYGTQVAFIVGGLAAVFAVGLGTLVG